MHQKRKTRQPQERTQQRAALPDEFVMTCMDNPAAGKRFAEIFRSFKPKGRPDE